MKLITRSILFSISCFLFLSIFGCSKQEVDVQVAPRLVEKKPVELVMWLVGSESQARSINELSQGFTKDTGIKVRCEAISWGEAHSKYLTSIAGEVTPDIGTMGLTWGTEFGNLGAMVDLAQSYPRDLSGIKEDTFDGIWQSVEYKDKVFGIPFDLTEHIMYYRTDIIEQPPSTWDELRELLLKLKVQGKSMIFDWGSIGWIGFSTYLRQAGGDFFDTNNVNCTIDSPESIKALEFFSELYNKLGVPKTMIPIEQGMRTGDFPLAISGNWKIIGLNLSAPEIAGIWSISMLPAGPTGKRTAFIGGRIMGIFTQSKHKEEAWKFVKFLFGPKIQQDLYKKAEADEDTYLPPNIEAWDMLDMDARMRTILKEQAMDAKGPPSVLGWDGAIYFIDKALQRVVLQGADPKRELSAAAKQVDNTVIK